MILVLSRASGETTTETVCDWLQHLGADFVRLNVEDLEYPTRFSYRPTGRRVLRFEDPLTGKDRSIALADVRVVWYRRWSSFETYHREHVDVLFDDAQRQYDLTHYLSQELRAVGEALFAGLRHAYWLSDAHSSKVDKARMLSIASEVGLEVPDTLIATTRSSLLDFCAEHARVITKNLGLRPYTVRLSGSGAGSYTTELSPDMLRAGPETFFPSMVQEHVDKAYELRSFVLGDTVHSIAIFSQADEQTSVDFRRYNDECPNRSVPYQLPKDVQAKLLELFGRLELNTGSADIIRTEDGRYVFLEINPIGQFGMVSIPCNYYLEKKLAAFLIAHDQT